MTKHKKNVIVLFGGRSTEHEISIITGVQVLNKIDKTKYNPIPVYISKDGKWYYSNSFFDIEILKDTNSIPYISEEVYLPANPTNKYLRSTKRKIFGGQIKIKVDILFPCLHGGSGENGSLQGMLELSGKPYVGSEVLGSALGMDKIVCKDIFTANNIPTARYHFFYRNEIHKNIQKIVDEIEKAFEYPVFVKPAVGGSSVGVTKAKNSDELKNGLELASLFDSRVIVEQGIEKAREINISVMGNIGEELKTSLCEEVFHKGDFLTYNDKYKGGEGKSQGMASTKREVPAKLPKETTDTIEDIAKRTFKYLNCCGLIRVDFLVSENPQQIYVIEVNTIPGSMGFYLWEASNVSFQELTTNLIELAERRFEEKKQSVQSFNTNILKNYKPGIKTSKIS